MSTPIMSVIFGSNFSARDALGENYGIPLSKFFIGGGYSLLFALFFLDDAKDFAAFSLQHGLNLTVLKLIAIAFMVYSFISAREWRTLKPLREKYKKLDSRLKKAVFWFGVAVYSASVALFFLPLALSDALLFTVFCQLI